MNRVIDQPVLRRACAPISVGERLTKTAFQAIRRRMILHHCKWDSQVEDVTALADFPLLISSETWEELRHLAEHLTAEALEAEQELLRRPDLWPALGIPQPLRRALAPASHETQFCVTAGRIMRFDFHWTTGGWQISEVNSDVPGGFTESTSFTQMVAEHYDDCITAGSAADVWADAIATAASHGVVALLSAPGLMEDHQILAYLAQCLNQRGCRTHLADPTAIEWDHQ